MFYKAEERGHIHILMNTDRRAIIKMVAQRKDLEWNKVENDDNIVNKSCFVSAGPGRGKTLRLCELYEKNVETSRRVLGETVKEFEPRALEYLETQKEYELVA